MACWDLINDEIWARLDRARPPGKPYFNAYAARKRAPLSLSAGDDGGVQAVEEGVAEFLRQGRQRGHAFDRRAQPVDLDARETAFFLV